jgi:tetratricopeptide (TPR) repeat protein
MKYFISLIFVLICFSNCDYSYRKENYSESVPRDKRKLTKQISQHSRLIHSGRLLQPSYYFRGLCYLELQDYKNALADFDSLVSLKTRGGFIFIDNEDSPFYSSKSNEISVLKAFFRRGQAFYYLDSFSRSFSDFQFCIDNGFKAKSTCYLWQGNGFLKQENHIKACASFILALENAKTETEKNNATQAVKVYCSSK